MKPRSARTGKTGAMTWDEIGCRLGISPTRAYRIFQRALAKIVRGASRAGLEPSP